MSLDLTTSYSRSWIYFVNSLKLEQIATGKLLSYNRPEPGRYVSWPCFV